MHCLDTAAVPTREIPKNNKLNGTLVSISHKTSELITENDSNIIEASEGGLNPSTIGILKNY